MLVGSCGLRLTPLSQHMEDSDSEAGPFKSLTDELEILRVTVRATLESYAAKMEEEILQVQNSIQKEAGKKKISSAKMHDMRDMLTLLRNTSIKSDKGRRKDLKKLDAVIGDLTMLTENW